MVELGSSNVIYNSKDIARKGGGKREVRRIFKILREV